MDRVHRGGPGGPCFVYVQLFMISSVFTNKDYHSFTFPSESLPRRKQRSNFGYLSEIILDQKGGRSVKLKLGMFPV